jgi:hypothetical protein
MSIQSEILPLRTLGKACHEGALERCCSVVCGLRPDIVEVAEQPPAISYIDDAGRHRRHIFNFRITTTKGERYLAAVKPSALVAISGIGRLIELVAEQMSPSLRTTSPSLLRKSFLGSISSTRKPSTRRLAIPVPRTMRSWPRLSSRWTVKLVSVNSFRDPPSADTALTRWSAL